MPRYSSLVGRLPRITKFNTTPAGTSIETMDSVVIPAGTLRNDGDVYAIEWRTKRANANSCTITVDCPPGTSLLADARAIDNDAIVWLEVERVNATTVRKRLRYLYGGATWYSPKPAGTGITDATAAITANIKFTNATAATDMVLVSRTETYTPAVA